jgi:thiamine biosynthesis lipoprotein
MGTVVVIDLFDELGVDPDAAIWPLRRCVEELHHADRVFSTYKDQSPLSRLRRGEIALGEAPPEVTEVLDLCRQVKEMTRGWFDPWAMPGGVDPTGLVKGWAAQRALEWLREAGLDGAMVNAGGDIATFGGPAPDEPFRIAVVRPSDRLSVAEVVEVRGAIATSGTYERGAHLIDPATGETASALASATVVGPDLAIADALATALCVGGDAVTPLFEALDGYEWLTVGHDGSRRVSDAFPLARAAS